jgi:hypothetical protein
MSREPHAHRRHTRRSGRRAGTRIPVRNQSNGAASDLSLRQLSWAYTRGAERQYCVLAVDTAQRVYELRIRLDAPSETVRVERFNYVSRALERQCEYEAQLIAAGFALERFDAIPV